LLRGECVVVAPYGDDDGYRSASAYICTPEPARLALLSLGWLALVRPKRK